MTKFGLPDIGVLAVLRNEDDKYAVIRFARRFAGNKAVACDKVLPPMQAKKISASWIVRVFPESV